MQKGARVPVAGPGVLGSGQRVPQRVDWGLMGLLMVQEAGRAKTLKGCFGPGSSGGVRHTSASNAAYLIGALLPVPPCRLCAQR